MSIRVLLVEDDADYRCVLCAFLDAEADVEVVGQAGGAEEALVIAARTRPDAILMDVRLPGMDGISATAALAEAVPAAAVVILTLFADEEALFAALAAGACGFVLKSALPADIVVALRHAVQGRLPLDPAMTRYLALRAAERSGPAAMPAAELAGLSPREREVLVLLTQGCTDVQLARRLGLSLSTVRTHLCRIRDKLGVRTRLELAMLATGHAGFSEAPTTVALPQDGQPLGSRTYD